MMDGRRDARLAFEALDQVLVRHDVLAELLERDDALERRLVSDVHDAHAALGDLPLEHEAAERLGLVAGHRTAVRPANPR
jgi:hypothetical protein